MPVGGILGPAVELHLLAAAVQLDGGTPVGVALGDERRSHDRRAAVVADPVRGVAGVVHEQVTEVEVPGDALDADLAGQVARAAAGVATVIGVATAVAVVVLAVGAVRVGVATAVAVLVAALRRLVGQGALALNEAAVAGDLDAEVVLAHATLLHLHHEVVRVPTGDLGEIDPAIGVPVLVHGGEAEPEGDAGAERHEGDAVGVQALVVGSDCDRVRPAHLRAAAVAVHTEALAVDVGPGGEVEDAAVAVPAVPAFRDLVGEVGVDGVDVDPRAGVGGGVVGAVPLEVAAAGGDDGEGEEEAEGVHEELRAWGETFRRPRTFFLSCQFSENYRDHSRPLGT